MAGQAATISRRAAVGVLAAAGAGLAMFGPRGRGESARGRVVLNYWEKWTGHEGRAMQEIVRRFNESQSRILVRYLATNGIDQKTMIAIAGGDPPDVVGLWNYNVPRYAEAGAILPIDDLASPFGVRLENYALGLRPIMQHPDREGRVRMWATINTGGTLALYYNRRLFREAGLDPDRPPRSISELDSASDALTVTRGGDIQRTGFLHVEPGWWSWIWGYHFGGSLLDAATNRALADSPENVAAFEWLQSYAARFDQGVLQRFRSGFGNYDSPLNAFLDGKVAMAVQGPWLANVISTFAPDLEYGVTPFAVADHLVDVSRPIGLIDTDILVIPRGVRHPEASMEFVAFTQRQENVEYLSTAHCKNSPLAISSEAFLSSHPNRGVRVHEAIAASPRGFVCPRTRTWQQLKDLWDALMQQAWAHKAPARVLLGDLRAKSQGILDQALDKQRRRYRRKGGAA